MEERVTSLAFEFQTVLHVLMLDGGPEVGLYTHICYYNPSVDSGSRLVCNRSPKLLHNVDDL